MPSWCLCNLHTRCIGHFESDSDRMMMARVSPCHFVSWSSQDSYVTDQTPVHLPPKERSIPANGEATRPKQDAADKNDDAGVSDATSPDEDISFD